MDTQGTRKLGSLLERDLHALTGEEGIRKPLPAFLLLAQEKSIVVVRVVVKECQPLHACPLCHLNRLLPTAVSPTLFLGQFLGCVLGVVDEQIGVAGQCDYIRVDPPVHVLNVRAVNERRGFFRDAVAVSFPRVIVLGGENVDVARRRESRDLRLPEHHRRSHLFERHGKVVLLHLGLEGAGEAGGPSRPPVHGDGEMTSGVVRRLEEGEPLDVIPVCVRESDEDVIVLLDGLRQEIVPQLAQARACIEDGDAAVLESQEQAGGVAAEFRKVLLRNGDGPSRSIKSDLHIRPSRVLRALDVSVAEFDP